MQFVIAFAIILCKIALAALVYYFLPMTAITKM